MTVDAVGEFDDLSEWLASEDASRLQTALEQRIFKLLFSQEIDSPGFFQTAAQLAWIGTKPENRAQLYHEIVQVKISLDGAIEPCKSWWLKTANAVGHFFEDHTTEIVVGAAILAGGVALSAAAGGYALSVSVGGIIVAGVDSIWESFKGESPPQIPSVPPPSSKQEIAIFQQPITSIPVPKLNLPSHTEILVTTEGIWANGEFYPNELFKKSLSADILAKIDPNPLKQNLPSPNSPKPPQTEEQKVALSPPYPPPPSNSSSFEPPVSFKFTLFGEQNTSGYIGWINGINNTFEESRLSAEYLQKLTGNHPINAIYNHTHTPVVDVLESALLNHNGISILTADLLKKEWSAFHEANAIRPNARILWICHSQGTIHVRNALQQLPQEVRDRLIVVAIAPAAIVPKNLCFTSYNYASERDFIYKLEPVPLSFECKIIDGRINFEVTSAADYRDELIILPASEEATGIDHSFQNSTYRKALKYLIDEYQSRNGQYLLYEKGK